MTERQDLIIAKRIRDVREKHGLNQAQLAAKANITPAAISQIESGDRVPSTPVLRRIASVLTVSLDYLLGRSDESQLKDLLQDATVQKFFRNFRDLSATDKKQLMDHVEFLKSKNRQSK